MGTKLTPSDSRQCQADVPGNGPFILGGEIGDPNNGYRIRCKNKPTVIATENQPGEDGLVGSMSLCGTCQKVMKKQFGKDFASFEKIEG